MPVEPVYVPVLSATGISINAQIDAATCLAYSSNVLAVIFELDFSCPAANLAKRLNLGLHIPTKGLTIQLLMPRIPGLVYVDLMGCRHDQIFRYHTAILCGRNTYSGQYTGSCLYGRQPACTLRL